MAVTGTAPSLENIDSGISRHTGNKKKTLWLLRIQEVTMFQRTVWVQSHIQRNSNVFSVTAVHRSTTCLSSDRPLSNDIRRHAVTCNKHRSRWASVVNIWLIYVADDVCPFVSPDSLLQIFPFCVFMAIERVVSCHALNRKWLHPLRCCPDDRPKCACNSDESM